MLNHSLDEDWELDMGSKIKTALALGMMLTASTAMADVRSDVAQCDEYADVMLQSHSNSNQRSSAISSGANLLGAIIGGRDLGYAVEGAVRNQGYSAASDARMEASRREMYFRECMRDRNAGRR